MCRTKILVFVILMAILLAAELTLTFWVRHRVDHNGQTDFWSGIPMVFLGLQGYFLWRICIVSCFVDDDADNDHHDHGGNSSDNHVTVTIKELAVVNPYALIRSIPVIDFNSRNFEDVKECAVCLSELADGDKTKLLPSCKHWFHAYCIDTWLRLHATCPICRERVCLFQSNKPRSELSSPVEPPAATSQDASSGNPADVTAVVVDIPASPEIREIGLISAT